MRGICNYGHPLCDYKNCANSFQISDLCQLKVAAPRRTARGLFPSTGSGPVKLDLKNALYSIFLITVLSSSFLTTEKPASIYIAIGPW